VACIQDLIATQKYNLNNTKALHLLATVHSNRLPAVTCNNDSLCCKHFIFLSIENRKSDAQTVNDAMSKQTN